MTYEKREVLRRNSCQAIVWSSGETSKEKNFKKMPNFPGEGPTLYAVPYIP
jgi:hypothetical protein